jgi:hypothetical protein
MNRRLRDLLRGLRRCGKVALTNGGHPSICNRWVRSLACTVGPGHELDDLVWEKSSCQHDKCLVRGVKLDACDGVYARYISDPSDIAESLETRLTMRHDSLGWWR